MLPGPVARIAFALINVSAYSLRPWGESGLANYRLTMTGGLVQGLADLALSSVASERALCISAKVGQAKAVAVMEAKGALVIILASARLRAECITSSTRNIPI